MWIAAAIFEVDKFVPLKRVIYSIINRLKEIINIVHVITSVVLLYGLEPECDDLSEKANYELFQWQHRTVLDTWKVM